MAVLEGFIDLARLIERRAGYREGRPFVAGTGVSVGRIGLLHNEGLAAAEIADEMHLTLAQAHAALACYLLNKDLIDADLIAQDEETLRIADAHYARTTGK
ncbi:MAG: DUF433 domain-containing protein [Chloroflexi bacterium]|nr:DUF433 domain-containing protein [Chloroflexota bacterium]